MASKTCTRCLRILRSQSHSTSKSFQLLQDPNTRRISTSPNLSEKRNDETRVELDTRSGLQKLTTTNKSKVDEAQAEGQLLTTPPKLPPSALHQLQKDYVKARGRTGTMYMAYTATDKMYKVCKTEADYEIPQAADAKIDIPETEDGEDLGLGKGWWFNEMGLKPTFSTWSQVTMLHMYLFVVRIRNLPEVDAKNFQQYLLDHFFYDAEEKMTTHHRMNARATRNKNLKDLYLQWRGLLAAYDEGIAKGDAELAAAVWRNVFKADEEIDVGRLALTVSYVRRFLKQLDSLSDENFAEGDFAFFPPKAEIQVVATRSKMIDLPFSEKAAGEIST